MTWTNILPFCLILFICQNGLSQTNTKADSSFIVEASCGLCKFDLKDNECSLAIKHNNKIYQVKGTTIDDHGDAHAADGFCQAVRKAKVKGKFKGDIFYSEVFELIKTSDK